MISKSNRQRVAIVGRMNVGKSTLFNRLTESQKAITSSWAGTTRDENTATVIWRGQEFDLVDTGGLDVKDDEQLEERVIGAARRAMSEADLILLVVDVKAGLLPQDRKLIAELRGSTVPVFLIVNKVDTTFQEDSVAGEVHTMNMEPFYLVSATTGRSTGDLLDAIHNALESRVSADVPDERTKVAIVGRPNVGKSSFLNSILGEERVIVADQAHTTRDTNDIPYTYNGREFLLIDTAGIRKRSNVGMRWADKRLGQIEKESVRGAIFAMERADVVLLVLEAQMRITAQDKKIADLANEHGKGLILVINKWDLVEEKDSNTITEFTDYFDQGLPYLRWAPMVFTSATDHLRVRETLDLVMKVAERYEKGLSDEELEPIFAKVANKYHPKQHNMRKYKKMNAGLAGLTQIAVRPPRFQLLAKRPKDVPAALPNIIERGIRDAYDFDGVKIVVEITQK